MLGEPLTSLLIFFIVALLIFWLAGQLGLSEQTRNIILVVLVVVLVIWLVRGYV